MRLKSLNQIEMCVVERKPRRFRGPRLEGMPCTVGMQELIGVTEPPVGCSSSVGRREVRRQRCGTRWHRAFLGHCRSRSRRSGCSGRCSSETGARGAEARAIESGQEEAESRNRSRQGRSPYCSVSESMNFIDETQSILIMKSLMVVSGFVLLAALAGVTSPSISRTEPAI